MGTPCSTEKIRITPTASTGDSLNLDHPIVEVAYQFLSNIELFGNLEIAPAIVGYYAKKLKDSGQLIEIALGRLEQHDDNFQKVWNQLVSELKIVSNLMRGAIKDPLFNEYLPIISYNLAEQQKILEVELGSKIRRAQSNIILTKVQRVDKRHKTDKI